MSAPLLAAQRIQTDLAGLTSPVRTEFRTAGTTATEAVSSLVHGESGSLGYLFDNLYTVPVADPLRSVDRPGPNGGAPLTGSSFGRPTAAVVQPPPEVAAPQVQVQPAPPDLIGQAQERIRGIFGG